MAIKSSAQINDPAAETLQNIRGAVDILTLLTKIQADPDFLTNLSKQLAGAYALTQPEMDERAAAVKAVSEAKSSLNDINAQMTQVQQDIGAAKSTSAAQIKADLQASDDYVKGAGAVIKQRWDALDVYKKELDVRELEVASKEKKNDDDAAANSTLKTKIDSRQKALVEFADALRKIVPNAPILEQDHQTE